MRDIWGFLLQPLTASGAAVLLLIVKRMFRDKLPPQWQFAVWGILGLVLLMPAGLTGRYALVNWPWLVETVKTVLTGDYGLTKIVAPIPLPPLAAPATAAQWLYCLYLAGVLVLLARYVISYIRLRLALRRGMPANAEQVDRVAEQYGLRACRAVEVSGLTSAFVCGVFRPVLALPAGTAVDDKVILHELLHRKQRDTAWGLVICCLRCIHWCNPLLWYCADQAANDLEARCDQRVLELLEGEDRRNYGHKLVCKDTTDDFGRPATEWKYDGDKVGTYADDADGRYVMEKSDKTTEYALVDTDAMNYDDDDVLDSAVVYFNGAEVGTYKSLKGKTVAQAGDIVEAFENGDDEVDTIVVIRYVAAEIDEVEDDLSTTLTKKGATYSVALTKVDTAANIPAGPFYDDHSDSSKVLTGFNADTYTEDTVLAVAFKCNGTVGEYVDEVLDSYVAEQTTSTVSSYTKTYIMASGSKYTYAVEVDGVTPGSVSYSDDDEYDIYTSAEGYAIAIVGAGLADLDDVYYVTGTYGTDSSYGGTTYYAQAVKVMTGEVVELKLEHNKSVENDAFKSVGSGWSTELAGLYVMTDKKIVAENEIKDEDSKEVLYAKNATICKSSNDKYNGVKFTGNSDWDVYADTTLYDDVDSDDSSIKLTKGNSYERLYLNSKTFFVAAEDVKGDLAVTTATGVMKMNKNDPTFVAVITEDGSNKASYVVYAGGDLGSAVSSDNVVYLAAGQDFDQNTSDDTTNASLWFMETLTEEDVVLDGLFEDEDRGFYTYDVDSDDVYDLDDATEITAKVDDDTDGYAMNLVVSDTRKSYNDDNHLLSVGNYFDDVSYADAKIVDTRSSADKNNDVYTSTISTVSAFERAMDKGDVTIDVYVEDGDIVFIAIYDVENVTPAEKEEETAISYTGVPTFTGGARKITVDLSLTNGEACKKTDLDGTLTYVALKANSINGSWEKEVSGQLTITDGVATGTIADLAAGEYKVDWTINIAGVTDSGLSGTKTVTAAG